MFCTKQYLQHIEELSADTVWEPGIFTLDVHPQP